jgi:hypothetical protein
VRAGALIAARTGRDINKMLHLVSALLDFSLSLGEQVLGNREDLRQALQQAAVLHQLDGITG